MAIASLAPLRHRNYALSWSSSFVSSIGTWMQATAVGIYLYKTTHNTLWLGLATAAAWLPAIIGSPLGGAVSDRWNRQRWIQLNNLVMATCATTLAFAEFAGRLSPTLIVSLALIEGLASSASWAGWQALLRDLVPEHDVVGAVSLSSAGFNLGRIIGPAAAGIAIALGSYGACFVANAASFIVVVVAFWFVRTPPRRAVDSRFRLVGDTLEGAKAAWASPACRHAIAGVFVIGVVVAPFISLIPAMCTDALSHARTGTAALMTAQGVGAVIAAFTLPSVVRRTSRMAVLFGSLAVLVVALLIYGLAISFEVSLLALVVVGGAYIGTLTSLNTTVQLHAPTAERSRILALYTLSLSMSFPLGALVQGALARVFGVGDVTIFSALVAGALLAATALVRPRVFSEMGAPAAA